MNRYVIYPAQSIKDISDAIKEKRGINDDTTFTVAEMPGAIRAIRGDSGESSSGGQIRAINLDTILHSNNTMKYCAITTEQFNEIYNYYNNGDTVIITDNTPRQYKVYNIITDHNVKIQYQGNDSALYSNRTIFIVSIDWTEDDEFVERYLEVRFLTDSYTTP